MKKVAYIAGPYRAPTRAGVIANIRRAREVSRLAWEAGYAAICPHMNTALLDSDRLTPDVFLEGDLEIIRRFKPGRDVMIMMDGWESSEGARGEKELADLMGIEVIYEQEFREECEVAA